MKQTKEIVKEVDKIEDAVAENNVHKDRYLNAKEHNSDDLNEEQLGVRLGFSKEYTQKIIKDIKVDDKKTPHSGTKGLHDTKEEK